MTLGYKILIYFAVTVSLITFFFLFVCYPAPPKKNVSESEQEKDAQIFELRSRVAKLKEENAVLQMEKEEERTIVESWVNGYAKLESQLKAKEQAQYDLQKDYEELKKERDLLVATNATLSDSVLDREQKYSELKAMYNETKADCDAHWEQLCSIMRTHPEVFPESHGVDDRWEGDTGGMEE